MPSSTPPILKRPAGESSEKPKKRRKIKETGVGRSIWNSVDDWDQLVADSQLSTASISSRKPRPRGVSTLVRCAADAAARGFKRIWEETGYERQVGADGGAASGGYWKESWVWVPDHLKEGVRDAVFRYWGGYLTPGMVQEVFAVPPSLFLPGGNLTSVSTSTTSRPFRPISGLESYTSLIMTGASAVSDVGFAEMIYHLPNLEVVNLKGCQHAGEKAVKSMIDRCPSLRRINLKGTAVNERGVKRLLDRFGQQLESFKVDDTIIENVNETFEAGPFPQLTHLCVPGDLLNVTRGELQRIRRAGAARHLPQPRPTPEGSIVDWSTWAETFPALTHLYLPRSFIPPTHFGLRANTITKLSFTAGPPLPIHTLVDLVSAQSGSLRKIRFGNLVSREGVAARLAAFDALAEVLSRCELEDFRLQCGETDNFQAMNDMRAYGTVLFSGIKGPWRKSMKHLLLDVPFPLAGSDFEPDVPDVECPVLETLDLPGAKIQNTDGLCTALQQFRLLRSLDLSATAVNNDDVFRVLDSCWLLSRIDLTSCRGVRVQDRRNIFKAWEQDRNPPEVKTAGLRRRSRR